MAPRSGLHQHSRDFFAVRGQPRKIQDVDIGNVAAEAAQVGTRWPVERCIKTSGGQELHAGRGLFRPPVDDGDSHRFGTSVCRKQVTRWSFTMPVACMKA